jgi:hypothetical protein
MKAKVKPITNSASTRRQSAGNASWKSSWKKEGGAWAYEPSERIRRESKPDAGQQKLFS